MIVQFSAIIDGVTAKKDRTLSLKIGSQELPPEDTAKIFEHQGHQIWVAMAENPLATEDLDIPDSVNRIGEKSPSQKLRERLAVYYKSQKGSYEGFENWYKDILEKIGQNYLDKMD